MVLDIELNGQNIEDPSKENIEVDNKEGKEFKEKPRKRKGSFLRFFLITLLLVFLGGVGYVIWKGHKISANVGFKFNPTSLITTKKPELEKDSEGKHTNILLVGVDSRNGSDISNTDSIIIASYSYETNNVHLVSIPRDFHVEVDKKAKWFGRINSVYAKEENKVKGGGFEGLKRSVTEVTGLEIQYHALVDFKAFEEIIDTLGGVNVNVDNSFTDYQYPSGNKYKTISFKAGPQVMDGKKALEYARSRHSMQNNEGTDYARARRQQKVIVAIQNKISQSDTLKDPKALMDMFSSVVNNIKISEFTIKDIQAALELLNKFEDESGKSYSFVLDPTVGGGELVERVIVPSGAFAIGPREGLGKYAKINKFVEIAMDNPKLYSTNPKVFVYDIGLGYTELAKKVKELREQFPFVSIIQSGSILKGQEGVHVYSNNEKMTECSKEFAKKLNTENMQKPEFVKSNLNPDGIIILFGKTVSTAETKEE